jgi:hypothetical protein
MGCRAGLSEQIRMDAGAGQNIIRSLPSILLSGSNPVEASAQENAVLVDDALRRARSMLSRACVRPEPPLTTRSGL